MLPEPSSKLDASPVRPEGHPASDAQRSAVRAEFPEPLPQEQGKSVAVQSAASPHAALEEPADALTIDVSHTVKEIADEICFRLNLPRGVDAK